MTDNAHCRNDTRCRAYDATTGRAAPTGRTPLCDPCLTAAGHGLRALLWDLLDLAQLHTPSLAQPLGQHGGAHRDPPMPLAAGPEALTAEIVHVLTTWETEIRAVCGLHEPATHGPAAPWHTTITRRPAHARQRPGAAAQRAIAVLAPRIHDLARLPPTAVYPTGCEDTPTDMDGVDAVQQLTRLHHRARALLGRTRRTFWVPGECALCGANPTPGVDGPLYRSEPRQAGDDPPIWCDHCGGWRTDADYRRYLTMLVWPTTRPDRQGQETAA
jgi:hypothetical protein